MASQDFPTVENVQSQGGELKELFREAIRRSLVPLVIILPLLVVCRQVGEGLPIDALTLGIYVAVAALLIGCERFLAFRSEWGSAVKGRLTDFIYVGAATLVEKLSFLGCVTLVAAAGRFLSNAFEIGFWPSGWPLLVQVILALLVADVGTYFRHRLFHWSPVLWRFHRIHHSVTGLYWIRSAYTHPIEQFCIMMAIMFPIALVGAGNGVIAIVAFTYGLSGLLQHANIDCRSSFFNYIFATAEVHRIHHRADERGNRSNFSAFFVFMDLLFGTYCRPTAAEAPVRVGLEGVTAFPGSFLTHLGMPFQKDEEPRA